MFAIGLLLCFLSHFAAGSNHFESEDFHFTFVDSD
jgi:hypothetical protein